MYVYSPLRQKREIKQKKEHTDRDRQITYYTQETHQEMR